MNYDIPGFLENIEPRFKWIDPAEVSCSKSFCDTLQFDLMITLFKILIESFRHTTQSVTIYTSHRPCSVPHIVIHQSPLNDLIVVWNNSPNSQNYFFLAISSPASSYYDYKITDTDYFTDASSSLCDSSAAVTPEGFSCMLEQDLDISPGEDTYETQHNNHEVTMIPQYSELRNDRTFPSNTKLFIPDDKEDSLPPLDGWYIAIANRCMPP
jgi:hypothetical protein